MTSDYTNLLLDSVDKRFHDETIRRLEEPSAKKARAWLVGVHERANMGDMALTYAAEVFLRKWLPRLEHVTLSRGVMTHNWQRIKPLISEQDLIFLPGGGNLGDLWLHEEAFRRLIVKSFPKNRIIQLPQSVHFDHEEELQKSSEIYRNHERLLMFARDTQSLERMKELTGAVELAPDMVFSYEYPVPFLAQNPERTLVIARNDKECGDFDLGQWAAKELYLGNQNLALSDTVYPDLEFHGGAFSAKSVYKKIDECHSAGLVITNRLHGAIFALVAGRPVIAYDNSYGKISAALAGLEEKLPGRIVQLQDAPRPELIHELSSMADSQESTASLLKREFTSMANRILGFIQDPTARLVYA